MTSFARAPHSSAMAGKLLRGIGPEFESSGSGAVVVVQHAAQPLAALDLTVVAEMARLWTDELVCQALVIAFAVIVGDEVLNGCPQGLLPEEDYAIQAGLLDAPYKSLRVGVQIRRPRWELHRLYSSVGYHAQELRGEQGVAVVNQVAFSSQDSILRIREIPGAEVLAGRPLARVLFDRSGQTPSLCAGVPGTGAQNPDLYRRRHRPGMEARERRVLLSQWR